MKHDTPLSSDHLAKLKISKQHWQRGGKPVSMAGVRVMEFKPLEVRPHPRQAEMDAYRNRRSLYA
jgi:hypothetical protein